VTAPTTSRPATLEPALVREPAPRRYDDDAALGLWPMLGVLVRGWRRLLLAGLLVGGVIGTYAVTRRRTWSAEASLVPQESGGDLARLGGLAAQFGVPLPGGSGAAASPDFYSALLRSRALLRDVVRTTYEYRDAAGVAQKGDLVTLLLIKGDTPAMREERAIDRLIDLSATGVSAKTSLVQLTVQAPAPELARLIAERMLQLLNRFNQERRQTRAGAERRFIEGRLADVRAELRTREESLRAFEQGNRVYDAPALGLARERLQTEVQTRRTLVMSLTESYERARMDEVRDTPVVTVVEPPHTPARPDSRRVLLKAIAGGLLGVLLAGIWMVTGAIMRRRRESGDPSFLEFRDAVRHATGR
jgi:uncharacterized protein involved in exopolysaccharide biosynthesis